jgi:hypothetical protein
VAETDKRSDWHSCLNHHRDFSTGKGVVFVPFGVEIAGGLGKEARSLYRQCLDWANGHNDVDSCHWIAMSLRRHWTTACLLRRLAAALGAARHPRPAGGSSRGADAGRGHVGTPVEDMLGTQGL